MSMLYMVELTSLTYNNSIFLTCFLILLAVVVYSAVAVMLQQKDPVLVIIVPVQDKEVSYVDVYTPLQFTVFVLPRYEIIVILARHVGVTAGIKYGSVVNLLVCFFDSFDYAGIQSLKNFSFEKFINTTFGLYNFLRIDGVDMYTSKYLTIYSQ